MVHSVGMTTQEERLERRKLWDELIADQQQSGKSISAFCRERGQKAHLFYYWRSWGQTATRHFSSAKPAF